MTIDAARREHPLRVVMLIPYDLEYQPFTIRTAMFASELVKRGHQVRIFYRQMRESKRGNRVHFALPDGCEVRDVRGFSRPRAWRQMAEVLRTADVVHFQKSLPPTTQVAMILGRRLGKAVHQDWDDYEFAFWSQAARDAWQSGAPLGTRVRKTVRATIASLLTGSMERIIPRAVDTLGGASMFLRQKSIEWGADAADVFPARVGVDAESFRPERRSEELRARLGLKGPTILFAGSFDVHPDLVFFAESLRTLFREAPEAQCLIVGGGFGRARLLELLGNDLPRGAVVMTDGLVPHSEVPAYVASADIAALPFRDTPVNRCKSSLTLLECMACGVPCLTHDVGDSGWMLGDGGVLAPQGDPQTFGRLLAELARDPARCQRLGRAARTRAVERFTWARSVDYLEAAYYHGLSKKAGNGRAA
jgi:glycosyltransferase involved in cell wall biosynthesis